MEFNTLDKFLSADDFRMFRYERDISMSELGRWLGVSYQAIQHYEKVGAHMPVAMALAAIEKGLQPDIDYEATGITRMAALAIVAQKNGLQPWQPGRNNMNQNEK